LLTFAVGSAPQIAQAQAHVDGAEKFVEQLADHAVAILTKDTIAPEKRSAEFRVLFQEGFAVDSIAKFALGRHWRRASEEEREEYLGLFEDSIVTSWANRLSKYGGERFEIISAEDVPTNGSEKAAIVHAMIWTSATSPIRIDWRVATNGRIYKVTDIAIAGISMANTRRDEFAAVIRRNGNKVSALNEVLRERSQG
jgi:phospholipid transport system substrate-binding protein